MDLASSVENNGVSDLILKLCNHLARNDSGMNVPPNILKLAFIIKYVYLFLLAYFL